MYTSLQNRTLLIYLQIIITKHLPVKQSGIQQMKSAMEGKVRSDIYSGKGTHRSCDLSEQWIQWTIENLIYFL